jgi:hypothetical protein
VRITIAHPRVLAVFLVVLALAGTALTVLAVSGDGGGPDPNDVGFTPVGGPTPIPFTITTDDVAAVRAAIDADGRLAKLNAGQPYQLKEERGEPTATGKLIAVDAVWANPVDSSGPWLVLVCQKTVAYTATGRWSNLRSVTVFVDLGKGAIAAFAPSGTAVELGAQLDQASDRVASPTCVEGKSDD